MRKIILSVYAVLILSLSLMGCGAQAKIDSRFNKVVYFNGVNQFEAVTIAQKKLLKSVYAPYYKTTKAKIRDDAAAQQLPDYWFVDFSQSMLFDAPSYLVVINKMTGDVIYSEEYFPQKLTTLDWILDRIRK